MPKAKSTKKVSAEKVVSEQVPEKIVVAEPKMTIVPKPKKLKLGLAVIISKIPRTDYRNAVGFIEGFVPDNSQYKVSYRQKMYWIKAEDLKPRD